MLGTSFKWEELNRRPFESPIFYVLMLLFGVFVFIYARLVIRHERRLSELQVLELRRIWAAAGRPWPYPDDHEN